MFTPQVSCGGYSGPTLRMIIGWGCASLVGAFGWWLGGLINLGFAVVLGAVLSGVGLYYGNRWFDDNLG
jgi:hypothetical protein